MKPPWKTTPFWRSLTLRLAPFIALLAIVTLGPLINPAFWGGLLLRLFKFFGPVKFVIFNAGGWLTIDLLLIVFITPALRPLKAYDRWRRLRCTRCSYNTVTQKTGERCPECGLEIPERPNLPRPRPPWPLFSRNSLLLIAAVALGIPTFRLLLPGFGRDPMDGAFLIGITIFSLLTVTVALYARHWSWKQNRCIRCRHHLPAPSEAATRCANCGALIPDPQQPA